MKKTDAERARQVLIANHWFSSQQAIGHEDGCVLLPIKSEAMEPVRQSGLGTLTEIYLPPLQAKPRSLSEALEGALTAEEMEQLVGSFDIVGDIAVMEIPASLQSHRQEIAKAVLEVHPQVKVVAQKTAGTGGPYRIRPIEVIAGPVRTLTICKESGCQIAIDLNAAYYTPRWSAERLRIASQVKEGEKVLVCFAGVGPYAIVIEKHSRPASILAVELNPQAVVLMRRNLELNHCQKIQVVEADARIALSSPLVGQWADRVLAPHPSEAEKFLPLLLRTVKPGGILHYYCFAPTADALKAAHARVLQSAAPFDHTLKLLGGRIVRPYSASLCQVVLDLQVDAPAPAPTAVPPARATKRKTQRPRPSSKKPKARSKSSLPLRAARTARQSKAARPRPAPAPASKPTRRPSSKAARKRS